MINLLYIGNKLSNSNSTLTTIETLGKALEQEGFNVKYASSFNNKILRVVHMLWEVIKNRNSLDYVLIDTYSTLNFYYAYLVSQLCQILKIKYVPILHGGNLPSRLENSPKLCKTIFNYAYKNVSPSEYIKKNFEEKGIHNIICIPNTIEIEKYLYLPKVIDNIKLLWVRSFSEIYNPKLAIDILQKFKRIYPDISLTMVGPEKDGSLEQTKKYASIKGVEVVFTGKLSKQQWLKIAHDHNVFINTTNFDNMPVSVIEAMALGLPVVSTNVGGMPFLITSSYDGILVPPNNPDAFVKEIGKLKNNKDFLFKIVENARVKAVNYSWSASKNKWLELLR